MGFLDVIGHHLDFQCNLNMTLETKLPTVNLSFQPPTHFV